MTMKPFDDSASKIAEYLLQIKAIKLQPKEPFTWASGWKSPIYCDNRKTLSYPQIRTFIRQQFTSLIHDKFGTPDFIAGVATGGIAIGALVAQELGLPFVYVRSEAKKHGLSNTIEGDIEAGNSVVVIEDLISTASSSIKAIEALKEKGCNVKGMVSIFNYGFDLATQKLKEINCVNHSLCDYHALIDVAVKHEYINKNDLESLRKWRENPSKWKP